MSFKDKIDKPGPKKLLTIDGGGIRGMMSIEVLSRIEQMLRDSHHNQELRLCDYFDYIAGTSTGAIIAAALAFGKTVDEVRFFYVNNGADMFEKASLFQKLRSLGASRFQDENLREQLQDVFGKDTTLGSEKLQSLLMVVLRNATTDSPWPLSNNPAAKFNDRALDDCNLDLPLWQIVRASTAAPTYFPPETVQMGTGDQRKQFIFVDGGVTMFNNPAFQLFKMATMKPYNLNWESGEENMLLVSVGTGFAADANRNLRPDEMNLIYNASSLPSALMNAALHEQDLLCRMFGNCHYGDPDSIDGEVESMINVPVAGLEKKLFTYVRYNAELTEHGLAELGVEGIKPVDVQKMDNVDNIEDLQTVGRAVGERSVRLEHFKGFLPQ